MVFTFRLRSPHRLGSLVPAVLVAIACSVRADGTAPPYDLRYIGRAIAWMGCYEASDIEAANPANLSKNVLAFLGTPDNPRVEVNYDADLPASVPGSARLTATFQLRMVQRPGWEPVQAIATVRRGARGTPFARFELKPTGGRDLWAVTFDSKGPGLYRFSVRFGGARYFHGCLTRTFTMVPDTGEVLTREIWFARHLVNETTDRSVVVGLVRGPEAQEARDDSFPQAQDSTQANVVRWERRDPAERKYGVGWSLQLAPEDVGREFLVGVMLRYAIGDGSIDIRDPNGQSLALTHVRPSPEVRTIWVVLKPQTPGLHQVFFRDEGVGRAEAAVYRYCYLKPADPNRTGPF